MTAFVNQHYRTAFPNAKLRTAAPAVTNKWLTEPTTFSPEVYRLYACARLGILPVNANRQPRTNNPRRNCLHCSVLETPTHVYSSCPRYMNQRRKRHDNAITAALPHLKSATATATQGLSTWIRERSLSRLLPVSTGDGTTRSPPNQSPDPSTVDHSLLRPDLYHLDHHRRVVTPVEFTVPDDANITESIDRKHQKYGPWLRAHPVAHVIRLDPTVAQSQGWTIGPLLVIAVGIWGTIPHSTITSLQQLGCSVVDSHRTLDAMLLAVADTNLLISRLRHSTESRWTGV